ALCTNNWSTVTGVGQELSLTAHSVPADAAWRRRRLRLGRPFRCQAGFRSGMDQALRPTWASAGRLPPSAVARCCAARLDAIRPPRVRPTPTAVLAGRRLRLERPEQLHKPWLRDARLNRAAETRGHSQPAGSG
ncbi:hypothetical protein GW17_00049605, partial [Ensete ventricosum]